MDHFPSGEWITFRAARPLSLHAARVELRTAILRDLGVTEADVPRVLSMAVDRLIEAHLIASSYFEFLATSGGPITTKGRQRRAVDGWNRASAVVAKFAVLVGLERRPKPLHASPRAWLESLQPDEPDDSPAVQADASEEHDV